MAAQKRIRTNKNEQIDVHNTTTAESEVDLTITKYLANTQIKNSNIDSEIVDEMFRLVVSYLIRRVYVHPVTLELVFEPFTYDEHFDDAAIRKMEVIHPEDRLDPTIIDDFISYLKTINWDTPVFTGVDKLHVFTNQNGNPTNIGGSCFRKKIPFTDYNFTVTGNGSAKNITYRDFIGAIYRMKSSKYDYWYELFESSVLIEEDSGELSCQVTFDYET